MSGASKTIIFCWNLQNTHQESLHATPTEFIAYRRA
ncbi:MAG: hypothetical protein ACI8XZ_002940, partial [Gammaproteobacteria bacterium]